MGPPAILHSFAEAVDASFRQQLALHTDSVVWTLSSLSCCFLIADRMLRLHQTTLHSRTQQRAASLTQVAAFTAARPRVRQVAVAVAPPDGGCAALDVCVEVPAAVPAELEQQRSFLESLPTLPEPGTPEYEFSSESFLQRYEMSEVLGEVRCILQCRLQALQRVCYSIGPAATIGASGEWGSAGPTAVAHCIVQLPYACMH